MKIFLFLVMFIFKLSYISSQVKNDFSWLIGSWNIQTPQGQVLESWKRVNDSLYVGVSIFINNQKDTIPQESIRLLKEGNDWYYMPKVSGQNDEKEVRFKLIFHHKFDVVFENKLHDFPQRIAYRRIDDRLFASIEGIMKDNYRKQNFDFFKSI